MKYLIRVQHGHKPGFAYVRLAGWKRQGDRSWKPFFSTGTPDCLCDWLKPRILRHGYGWRRYWRISADLPRAERVLFSQAMLRNKPVVWESNGPESEFSPAMEAATRPTRRRLRRAFEKYSAEPVPAIVTPPEPADFFENVKQISRSFTVFFRLEDGQWDSLEIARAGSVIYPWLVTISSNGVWRSGGSDSRAAWESDRHFVSPAWLANLSGLEYCLFCLESRSDPLGVWPRYRGGLVTTRTLEHCIAQGKRHTSALWHLSNQTKKAWFYV
jgi:hypothetical protein